MKQNKNIKYWADSSKKDFEVAQNLFKLKYYPHCLFFCHLSLEKLLKALVVKKTENYAPLIHDLRRLADIAGLELNSEKKEILGYYFDFQYCRPLHGRQI
jgi:HEPN domain-containing protein